MGQMKSWWEVCKERWKAEMPKFFKVMMRIFASIGTAVITIHITFDQLGIAAHEWWTEAEPLILGIAIGGCCVCKLTEKKGDIEIPSVTGYDKEQNMEN